MIARFFTLRLPLHERLREQGISFSRFHVNRSPCSRRARIFIRTYSIIAVTHSG